MLRYQPDSTIVHRLDPRAKLAFQLGFAIAAVTQTSLLWILALTGVGLVTLVVAHVPVRRVVRAYWFVLVLLALGPILGAVTLREPYVDPARAETSLRSVARIVPILFVSAAYIHTTSARETEAAVHRVVPGRAGRLLGAGIGLTFRMVPVIRRDVDRLRDAISARSGDSLRTQRKIQVLALFSFQRSLAHVDALSTALEARCLAWNPTEPRFRFTAHDYAVLALAALLAVTPVLP